MHNKFEQIKKFGGGKSGGTGGKLAMTALPLLVFLPGVFQMINDMNESEEEEVKMPIKNDNTDIFDNLN